MTTISASAPVVQATGLWKRFGDVTAVQDVSLSVRPGEIIGLVGPNGAGKTTTIRMLLDITQPDEGEVSVIRCRHDPGSPGAHRLPAGGARPLPKPASHPEPALSGRAQGRPQGARSAPGRRAPRTSRAQAAPAQEGPRAEPGTQPARPVCRDARPTIPRSSCSTSRSAGWTRSTCGS